MTCLFELSIALLITLLNGFFVMAEYSLVRIRKSRLDELIRQGKSRANTVLKMSEKLDTYLSATQLGITASSLLLGWFGGPLLAEMFRGMFGVSAGTWYDHSLVFACAFLIIVFLHVVFGELVPKSMAIQDTERYALIIAPPLYTFNKIFAPFIWVFDHVTMWILKLMGVKQADENEDAHSEEEIKLIIDASQKGGVIDDTESEIIQNAICFSEISAHEIMIPRQEMKCIYQNSSYNEVMEFVKQHKHTRFPLCNGDKDQIIGMIHIRDLLECKNSPHKDILSKIVRNILFVPENKSISEILHEMMKKRIHLAVVVDEYGVTAGLLSMEDILEELVGDIRDEHDDITEEPVKKINDTVCEFDGLYLVEDAYDCLGLPYDDNEHEESTMGGYVFNLLGREPVAGDKTEDDYCVYEVMQVDNMRITRIKTTVKQPQYETASAE